VVKSKFKVLLVSYTGVLHHVLFLNLIWSPSPGDKLLLEVEWPLLAAVLLNPMGLTIVSLGIIVQAHRVHRHLTDVALW
jgi:hypothetical protein